MAAPTCAHRQCSPTHPSVQIRHNWFHIVQITDVPFGSGLRINSHPWRWTEIMPLLNGFTEYIVLMCILICQLQRSPGFSGVSDWANKRPPASEHSAVIVSHWLVSARAAPHKAIQQDTIYILLVLCWLDSKVLIFVMVGHRTSLMDRWTDSVLLESLNLLRHFFLLFTT